MIRDILLMATVMLTAIALCVFIVWANVGFQPKVKRVDCTWSEISPDFTPAMREACRKARNERSN